MSSSPGCTSVATVNDAIERPGRGRARRSRCAGRPAAPRPARCRRSASSSATVLSSLTALAVVMIERTAVHRDGDGDGLDRRAHGDGVRGQRRGPSRGHVAAARSVLAAAATGGRRGGDGLADVVGCSAAVVVGAAARRGRRAAERVRVGDRGAHAHPGAATGVGGQHGPQHGEGEHAADDAGGGRETATDGERWLAGTHACSPISLGCRHCRSCAGIGALGTARRRFPHSGPRVVQVSGGPTTSVIAAPTCADSPSPRVPARATLGIVQPPADGNSWLALTEQPLPVGDVYDWCVQPQCGAVVLFSGTVRDHAATTTADAHRRAAPHLRGLRVAGRAAFAGHRRRTAHALAAHRPGRAAASHRSARR